jgi:hypothetical protein
MIGLSLYTIVLVATFICVIFPVVSDMLSILQDPVLNYRVKTWRQHRRLFQLHDLLFGWG